MHASSCRLHREMTQGGACMNLCILNVKFPWSPMFFIAAMIGFQEILL